MPCAICAGTYPAEIPDQATHTMISRKDQCTRTRMPRNEKREREEAIRWDAPIARE